jgi:hypothetical protein
MHFAREASVGGTISGTMTAIAPAACAAAKPGLESSMARQRSGATPSRAFHPCRAEQPGWSIARSRCRCAHALLRRLAQAIAAQAIAAVDRHRQFYGFLGAPARAGQAARKFRPAPGTGEAARQRIF